MRTSAAAGDGFEGVAKVVGQGSAAMMVCPLTAGPKSAPLRQSCIAGDAGEGCCIQWHLPRGSRSLVARVGELRDDFRPEDAGVVGTDMTVERRLTSGTRQSGRDGGNAARLRACSADISAARPCPGTLRPRRLCCA